MKKILDSLLILSISVALPLVLKIDLLLSWPIIVVLVAGFFLGITQPKYDIEKNDVNKNDGSSILMILLAVMACLFISVFEYGYISNTKVSIESQSSYIGLFLIIFGFGFRYYSIRVLGRFFTSKVKIQIDHELIETGPYRYLRHPSYLGAWLGIIGVAILLQSAYGVLACVLIFFPAYVYRISCEEKALIEKFPNTYPSYQRRTWKMFPLIF